MNRQVLIIISSIIMVSFLQTSVLTAREPPLAALSDYLAHAALNNPELKSRFEEWKAALEQIPQAKALDDPKFTYSYFIEEVETRVGPQQNKFGIMQTFPWFGKIEARTDAATAKAKAAQKRYDSAKLLLFRQVKDAFYEFSYLATAIGIANDNLELMKHFEEVARIKYRTSEATHPDVIRAQIELARLNDILNSLKKLKEPTVAGLNAVLNRKPGQDLDWPQKHAPRNIELAREKLIEKIIRANPEISELKWKTEAARAEVELATKKFYPDIGIGVDWIQTGDAITPGASDSGKDAVALMFSVNIPIWQDSYKAARRQARAKVRSLQQKKFDLENKKISQAMQIIYEIEDSKRKMDLYGHTLVSKAEELVQTSESAYRAGTIDFLSLIDAQRMLLKYKLDYERAIVDNQKSIAELESLTEEQF